MQGPRRNGALFLSVFLARLIGGVQNVMCPMAARFLKILIVQLLNDRVFVTLTQLHLTVLFVEPRRADRAHVSEVGHTRRLDRLASAADTTARASHDLDEVILLP